MKRMPIAVARKVEAEATAWAIAHLRKAATSDWGNMLGPDVPRQYARINLHNMAVKSGDGAEAVVGMARNGLDIAHEVALALYREQRQRDLTPFKCVEAYALEVLQPAYRRPRKRGSTLDDTFRNGVIVVTVLGVHRRFELKLTRSKHSSRPSACSVVADALKEGGFSVPMDEGRIRQIYDKYSEKILQYISIA